MKVKDREINNVLILWQFDLKTERMDMERAFDTMLSAEKLQKKMKWIGAMKPLRIMSVPGIKRKTEEPRKS